MTWSWHLFGRRVRGELLRLDEVLEALGDDGVMGRRCAEVPLADVVGTVSRPCDFDHRFRLTNQGLRQRWCGLERAVRSGAALPPVDLVQVGDLYFVLDGHHRVSVACSLRRDTTSARVLRMCTVAYARCRLRPEQLPSKAAERRFLQRVPLPVGLRCTLLLDDPAAWARLADAAQEWGRQQAQLGRRMSDRTEFAALWWREEVLPVVESMRAAGHGSGEPDVQVFATALAIRERQGGRRP